MLFNFFVGNIPQFISELALREGSHNEFLKEPVARDAYLMLQKGTTEGRG